ncbi:MAG: tricarballylate utilization 4Fe-4S protein TcuB [Acidobacteria bacterium]|nr:tricarballylate utilization 4Fe-4S protein TcuB [Acidobacteriota bacterium]
MPSSDVIRHGEYVMTVCNACRYCEQFCPVFPAMENRRTFAKADLMYLANLCHNCGECLYACQYAPPHEFGINAPRTLAELRTASYETYCWPQPLAGLFRRHGVTTSLVLVLAMSAAIFAGVVWSGGRVYPSGEGANFYAVMPHSMMVGLFGAVSAFVLAALAFGLRRFSRDVNVRPRPPVTARANGLALRDALTLRHLHASGDDCPSAEEQRAPWRRWFHHATFYGFALCFASTSVAAVYHSVFGWHAPHDLTSLPVVLGTLGGVGLLVGPAGLIALHRRRDRALGDPAQTGMDVSFITLLFITSLTGLLLLVLRERPVMGLLLIVHLGSVLALFVTLPYGKFVHGLYRVAALVQYAREDAPIDRA